MRNLLDELIPVWEVRERHARIVRAPAAVVARVARELDAQAIPAVRAIFEWRSRLMGVPVAPRTPRPFLAELASIGWATLADRPDLFAAGASCQPWRANVVFRPIPIDRFRDFAEPDQVKIAWTIETTALPDGRTELATETRVVATDLGARARFRRYWRWARFGIIPIRWLLLGAIRRRAEAAGRARPTADPIRSPGPDCGFTRTR